MKIVTKTEFVIEKGDKELIFSKLPDDPCKNCVMEGCLDGCTRREKYREIIENLKDHGVLELAIKANEYYKIEQRIKEINAKKRELREDFSELDLDITQIFKQNAES